MPRTTVSYVFEWKIHAWAQRLRGGDGFVALLGAAGDIVRVVEGDHASFGNRCVSHAIMEDVTGGQARWIFYDPFDAPEYAWLQWKGVPRATWEELLGASFVAEDFQGFGRVHDAVGEFPIAWGVMF
jgi:hypothetical protein